MMPDPRAPLRPALDRMSDALEWARWEGVAPPRAPDRERERFLLDTLAERRAPERPSWARRLLRRGAPR